MDFKRIEWIFFFAFLGLNLFLFNLYREAKIEQNITYRTNETIPIQQRLSSESIQYEGELSEDVLEGFYLSGIQSDFKEALKEERTRLSQPELLAEQTVVEGEYLTHLMDLRVTISEENQVSETLHQLLSQKNLILYGNEYEYLAEESFLTDDYAEIVAGQSYEGIPLNDPSARLVMVLEGEDDQWTATKYIQSHVSELNPLREVMPIYSEKEVINTLYVNNRIPVNSTILSRKLGYKMTLKVRGQGIYVPTWFIAIETLDRKVRTEMVNGFTNRIITNTVVQTVEDQ